LARLDEFPAYARFLFEDVHPDAAELNGGAEAIAAARDALAELEPFTAESIEAALRGVLERLGLKPRQGFQPIRIAVTGAKGSPGPRASRYGSCPLPFSRVKRPAGGPGYGR